MTSSPQQPETATAAFSVVHSPWYWVNLFCLAALITSSAIESKYNQRQLGIEYRHYAQQVSQAQALDPQAKLPERPGPIPKLSIMTPLRIVLIGGMLLSLGMIVREIRRHRQLKLLDNA